MKQFLFSNLRLYCIGLLIGLTCTSNLHAQQRSALLPYPNHISEMKGRAFSIKESATSISINDQSLIFAAEQLASIVEEKMGLRLEVPKQVTGNKLENKLPQKHAHNLTSIQLLIDNKTNDIASAHQKTSGPTDNTPAFTTSSQRYTLEVSSKRLTIRGASAQAVFYGIQTLHQLLTGDPCATARKEITPIHIEDEPRFAYRALMLDPARHFLPINDVKFYIDQKIGRAHV